MPTPQDPRNRKKKGASFEIRVDDDLLQEALQAVEQREKARPTRPAQTPVTEDEMPVFEIEEVPVDLGAAVAEAAAPRSTASTEVEKPAAGRKKALSDKMRKAAEALSKLASTRLADLPHAPPRATREPTPPPPVQPKEKEEEDTSDHPTEDAPVRMVVQPTRPVVADASPVEAPTPPPAASTPEPTPPPASEEIPSRVQRANADKAAADAVLARKLQDLEGRLSEAEQAFIDAQIAASQRRNEETSALQGRLLELESAMAREREARAAIQSELEDALMRERDAHVATGAELEAVLPLVREIEQCRLDDSRLRKENGRLRDENRDFRNEALRLSLEVDCLKEENARLTLATERKQIEVERFVQSLSDERRDHRNKRKTLEEALLASQQKIEQKDAEMDLVQRRAQRDVEAARAFGHESTIRMFLPALDDLERAVSHSAQGAEAILPGLKMVADQFARNLQRMGVVRIPTQSGTAFDPVVHEALLRVPTDAQASGTILGEIRSGWMLNTRLLRAAQVMVASCPDAPVHPEVAVTPDRDDASPTSVESSPEE